MKLAVLIKQVPMVSELPWDRKTGELKREMAGGMMNPACRHALEAALRLKEKHGGEIGVISMGPPAAEEVLREALALGADRAWLLCDPGFAGADTLATSYALARAVSVLEPGFDLLLLGCQTADSETGQVGPQVAAELDVPSATYVEELSVDEGSKKVKASRVQDGFLEKLEMDFPAVLSISTHRYHPRDVSMIGLAAAFDQGEFSVLSPADIWCDLTQVGRVGSGSRIAKVYSPTADHKGELISGAPKKIVSTLLEKYGDRMAGLIGRDLGGGK